MPSDVVVGALISAGCEKRDIWPIMLVGGNVLCWIAIYEVEIHEETLRLITLQQIDEEAGIRSRQLLRTTSTLPSSAALGSFKAYSMRSTAMRS